MKCSEGGRPMGICRPTSARVCRLSTTARLWVRHSCSRFPLQATWALCHHPTCESCRALARLSRVPPAPHAPWLVMPAAAAWAWAPCCLLHILQIERQVKETVEDVLLDQGLGAYRYVEGVDAAGGQDA